ncbi:cyclic nucleotide-gated cation channel subunit a [Holotrichia oblita]|uniref:Cyclic nucleotide-gated cation channel subunit a n=1 Tax=Holotrichia oblita TaxID=644536 RepID=A0ACB9TKR9_HOLOL|nr:cyclic nucleotide-gated cation channel subunit a [Holotrichia oblita]
MYSKYITTIPLFAFLDDKAVSDMCRQVNVVMYTRDQIITYAGEICHEMHYILHGQCKRVDRRGHISILKPNDFFSFFEVSMGMLAIHTIVTITDCKILTITARDYQHFVRKFRHLKEHIDEAVMHCKENERYYLVADDKRISQFDLVSFETIKAAKSFHVFKMYKKVSENVSFFIGYGLWMRCAKFFLMRITITTYGRFLFGYEVFRVIMVLATNFLCSSAVIIDDKAFFYALLTFDILAWLDLYIMHHVCYFNKIGLEISHPALTAKHYWTHSLLMDLIGCLPLDYAVPVKSRRGFQLRLNRCFQIRRILSFFNYLNANNISRSGLQDIMKYFPLCVLIINYIAMFFLATNCDMTKPNQRKDECACRYLVKRKMSNVTFTPMNMQAASLLFISSTLAMIGMTRFYLKTFAEMIFLSLLVLFAVFFSIWLTAKMVANNFYRNSDLTTYQQAIKELVLFFSYRKVDKNIKKEIINHYEHVWKKKRCKNLHHMTSYFNTCFKEDLLFDIFGEKMLASQLFPGADKSFYKSLLLEMEHIVLLKRAIIYKVNDVHDQIYFLLRGEVEVLGADHKKLQILSNGSLFGSLDNYPFMRQTLMMIAKNNVELLRISSSQFHHILSQYDRIYRHYLHLTSMHNDYIESQVYFGSQKTLISAYKYVGHHNFVYQVYRKLNPIYKQNAVIRIWQLFTLIMTGFLGVHLELYQKITWDTTQWILGVLYFLDLLHAMKIYLNFHTTYVNEFGMTVMDRRKIAKHYLKNKLEFYIDIISVIPLDAVGIIPC